MWRKKPKSGESVEREKALEKSSEQGDDITISSDITIRIEDDESVLNELSKKEFGSRSRLDENQ